MTISTSALNALSQIEFEAVQGNHTRGFVAFDDLRLAQTDDCLFKPAEAWPIDPTTSTTTPSSTESGPTTPAPTEPPDRKILMDS